MRVLVLSILVAFLGGPVWAASGGKAESPLVVYGENWHIKPRDPAQAREVEQTMARVVAFMDRTGIPYEMRFPPRPRKFALQMRGEPALFFEYLRTPERERAYHWILPLEAGYRLHLFALKGSPAASLSIAELKASSLIAACEVQTIGCETLARFGFDEKRILATPLTVTTGLENLLLAGRAAVVVGTEQIIRRNMGSLGIDQADVVSAGKIAEYTGYLTASLGLDPALLKRLKATPQDGLPVIEP